MFGSVTSNDVRDRRASLLRSGCCAIFISAEFGNSIHNGIFIPMGGLSPDHTRWVHPRYLFLLPIGVLKRVFRRRFVKALKLAYRQKKLRFFGQIAELEHPKRFAAFLRTL